MSDAKGGSGLLLGSAAIAAAIKSGNVNIASNMRVEEMDLSSESRESQLKHAETLRRFEAQQRARTMIVPTLVDDVKKKLRELGQPVTIFGEGPADRRERLKEVIARMELNETEAREMQKYLKRSSASQVAMPGGYGEALKSAAAHAAASKEIFYSPAIEQLVEARKRICEYSFPRTHERILRTKRIRENETLQIEEDSVAAQLYVHAKTLALEGSQFADFRPLSCVRFSPDGSLVAVGSWTGSVKLWDSESLERVDLLGGHIERVTSVSWQPVSQEGNENSLGLLASSSADGTCRLWDCRTVNRANRHIEKELATTTHAISNGDEDMELVESHPQIITTSTIASQSQASVPTSGARKLSVLRGHQGGLTKCCFHPNGKYVGTSGLDFTWRLWDVETSTELQLQDGHIRECNAIDFHQDGSLTATGDTGGVILVWDVRSGQSIQAFQGHIKKVVSVHWNQNGFQLASGSTDNTVKIWDLRSKKCSYTLPAHSNVLSEARFSSSGELLLTSSFDSKIKLWNTRNYDILKTLSGHNGKIMCCDIAPDERRIISGGYDRTIKLWKKAS